MLRTYYLSIKQDITTPKGEKQSFQYDKEVEVKLCKVRSVTPSHYDAEDKIMLAGNPQTILNFELCLSSVQLKLEKPWRKAKELLRILEHRYDWMLVKVNATKGKPIEIINRDEIQSNWQRMKQMLLPEYIGDEVEKHLEKVGAESFNDNKIWTCFDQYSYFGLLFPQVPLRRTSNYTKSRNIDLANRLKFSESISFDSSIENIDYFTLKGELQEVAFFDNKSIDIQNYSGKLAIAKGEIIPTEGDIEISYTSGQNLFDWQFHLEEIVD